MTPSPSKEVAVPDAEQYPAIFGGSDLAEIIADNFGPDGVQPQDLDRVKVPSGGGTAWEVPTLTGLEPTKALDGIILYVQSPRKYWRLKMEESGTETVPPDCASDDGVVGIGAYGRGSLDNPSGACETCPMNAWGSAKGDNSKGKACRESRMLYLLRPGDVIPITVTLPATSIAGLRKYLLRLTGASKPYYGVVTRLELEKHTGNGVQWSQVIPSLVAELAPEQIVAVKAFAAPLRAAAESRAAARVNAVDTTATEADS